MGLMDSLPSKPEEGGVSDLPKKLHGFLDIFFIKRLLYRLYKKFYKKSRGEKCLFRRGKRHAGKEIAELCAWAFPQRLFYYVNKT